MRRLFLFACLLVLSAAAAAEDFPSRPVKIYTPYSTGIGPDLYVRALAAALEKEWNQPVVVESKPGGNGFIAIDTLKKAAPDGYELLILADSHLTINPNLFKQVPYDPQRDFAPIAGLFRTYFYVAVKSDGPYQTVPQLIAGAKANPGKLSYGSPYIGSPSHLGSAVFEYETGTKMLHVPYKDQLQIYTSIANGELTWTLATSASSRAMVNAGRVKLIAVAAPRRLASHPDVPTVEEAGGPKDFVVESWLVAVAPRGTPAELVHRIHDDVDKAIATPEMQKRYAVLGFEPLPLTPEQASAKIAAGLKENGEVIRRIGLKPQ
jgi:tripartite-type tricarboxylate transporter receptor subunit TctC